MAMVDQTPVMDISPWPSGQGFEGARDWWEDMLSRDEKQRLDNLMGVALLDTEICHRLVTERDSTLFNAFGLSEKTQQWLHDIQARTLNEFARAIVSRTQGDYCISA